MDFRQPRARRGGRSFIRFAVSLAWLALMGVAVAMGYWLARHDALSAQANLETLRNDVAILSGEVARARAERVRLERAHQMDREAKRQAQQALVELQQERLLLTKRVAYLQRLVRDGQDGIVEVKDLQVTPTDTPGRYAFQLVLSQLVPQSGRTKGRVSIYLVVSRDGEERKRSLDAFEGSSPGSTAVDFEYFQAVSGTILVADGDEPRRIVIEIEPEGESVAASSEVFLWPSRADGSLTPCPIPVDDALAPQEKPSLNEGL